MEHDKQVIIVRTKEECIKKIITLWKSVSLETIEKKGRFNVALSGGNTPRALYRALCLQPEFDWNKTHIYQVDERYVSEACSDSNFGMIEKSLISKISIPKKNVHRIDTTISPISKCAEQYAKEVDKVRKFDLIILGIGIDGHTASLFPGHSTLKLSGISVSSVVGLGNKVDRITLTYPAINKASHVLFLVTGKNKGRIVSKVVCSDPAYPASYVKPSNGYLYFVTDEIAGEFIKDNVQSKKYFNRFPY